MCSTPLSWLWCCLWLSCMQNSLLISNRKHFPLSNFYEIASLVVWLRHFHHFPKLFFLFSHQINQNDLNSILKSRIKRFPLSTFHRITIPTPKPRHLHISLKCHQSHIIKLTKTIFNSSQYQTGTFPTFHLSQNYSSLS